MSRRAARISLLSLALAACSGGRFLEQSRPIILPSGDAAPRAPRSAAHVEAPPSRITVAVVSDLNGEYGSTEYGGAVRGAIARLVEGRPDLVLSTGDMVAGQRAGVDHLAMWAAFHAAVTDPLTAAGVPFAITPGNHDASGYPIFAAERELFEVEWCARRPDVQFVDDSHYPLRYSFVVGPVLFVSLDATTVGPLCGPQMRWLDAQLATDAPVKVVFGHVPLYPFARGREREFIGDPALEELLLRHRVDLFVSGHHHAYYPGRRGPLRLVSMACLGTGSRSLIGSEQPGGPSILLFEADRDSGIRALDAFGGPRFDREVDRAALPPQVGEGALRIDRDDLGAPLTRLQ